MWTCFAGKLPENCFPLFMTSKTQEIFHCQCDVDVTEDNPIKIITKQEILDDMRMRAAVSDFSPFKQQILVCTSWDRLSNHWFGMCINTCYFLQRYMDACTRHCTGLAQYSRSLLIIPTHTQTKKWPNRKFQILIDGMTLVIQRTSNSPPPPPLSPFCLSLFVFYCGWAIVYFF